QDDPVDVRIAFDDLGWPGQRQHVDCRLRPGVAQASDQRRGQQQVADPAQRDHQNARPRWQRDGRFRIRVHRDPAAAARAPLENFTLPFYSRSERLSKASPGARFLSSPEPPSARALPTIEVSWGELIDKITILEIKEQRLTSPAAVAN